MSFDISHNIEIIQKKITETAKRIGSPEQEIKLLAASKAQSIDKMKIAYAAGIRNFGENYVQEFLKKWEFLKNWTPKPNLYFIGHLQTNKVKYLVDKINEIQTIDSPKLIQTLLKEEEKNKKIIPIMIEINIAEEKSKRGVSPKNLISFLEALPKHPLLQIRGLMTLPPFQEDPEKTRPYFKRMRELLEESKLKYPHFELKELSMGMTHDFQIAIEEGSTQVRIGEGIFGKR